jgi:hypothetical protein
VESHKPQLQDAQLHVVDNHELPVPQKSPGKPDLEPPEKQKRQQKETDEQQSAQEEKKVSGRKKLLNCHTLPPQIYRAEQLQCQALQDLVAYYLIIWDPGVRSGVSCVSPLRYIQAFQAFHALRRAKKDGKASHDELQKLQEALRQATLEISTASFYSEAQIHGHQRRARLARQAAMGTADATSRCDALQQIRRSTSPAQHSDYVTHTVLHAGSMWRYALSSSSLKAAFTAFASRQSAIDRTALRLH